MRYLAIDLECANQFVTGSACSIGIVEADEGFGIVNKEDIIINPNCRIFDKHCKLAYDPKLYKQAPDFVKLYPRLKQLLESDDTLIVGHAINNDIMFLEQACKRYGLEPLRFRYICTQNLYREYAKEVNSISIESVVKLLELSDLTAHKAEDDAFVSLKLLQHLIEVGGSLDQMLNRYKMIVGEYAGAMHVKQLSGRQNREKLFEHAVQKHNNFYGYTRKERRKLVKFRFDNALIQEDADYARDLLLEMLDGGLYYYEFNGLNKYVILDGTTPARLSKIETVNSSGGAIEVIPHTALPAPKKHDYSKDAQLIRAFSVSQGR